MLCANSGSGIHGCPLLSDAWTTFMYNKETRYTRQLKKHETLFPECLCKIWDRIWADKIFFRIDPELHLWQPLSSFQNATNMRSVGKEATKTFCKMPLRTRTNCKKSFGFCSAWNSVQFTNPSVWWTHAIRRILQSCSFQQNKSFRDTQNCRTMPLRIKLPVFRSQSWIRWFLVFEKPCMFADWLYTSPEPEETSSSWQPVGQSDARFFQKVQFLQSISTVRSITEWINAKISAGFCSQRKPQGFRTLWWILRQAQNWLFRFFRVFFTRKWYPSQPPQVIQFLQIFVLFLFCFVFFWGGGLQKDWRHLFHQSSIGGCSTWADSFVQCYFWSSLFCGHTQHATPIIELDLTLRAKGPFSNWSISFRSCIGLEDAFVKSALHGQNTWTLRSLWFNLIQVFCTFCCLFSLLICSHLRSVPKLSLKYHFEQTQQIIPDFTTFGVPPEKRRWWPSWRVETRYSLRRASPLSPSCPQILPPRSRAQTPDSRLASGTPWDRICHLNRMKAQWIRESDNIFLKRHQKFWSGGLARAGRRSLIPGA